MHTEKFNLLKTCTILFFLGRKVKRKTRRLNRCISSGSLCSKRTVRAASELEHALSAFHLNEHKAIRLFLRLSARQ